MARRSLSVAAMLALPVAAAAQDSARPAPPVEPEVIQDAVASCVAASVNGHLDRQALETSGWSSKAKFEIDGQEKPNEMEFRTRADSNVLMITPPGHDMCIIVGRLANVGKMAEVRKAILRAYPGQPVDLGEAGEVWSNGDHMFSLAPTGKKDAPSIRVAVGQKEAL